MLQWEDPSINGEVRIDNYTVILTSDNDSDVTVIEELLHYTFSLRYNVDYNLSVSVTNCMGEGEYATINISKGIYLCI